MKKLPDITCVMPEVFMWRKIQNKKMLIGTTQQNRKFAPIVGRGHDPADQVGKAVRQK
ncbi:MAG: hypothetical protein ACI3VA_07885 [Candidatus Limivicinus sp.]